MGLRLPAFAILAATFAAPAWASTDGMLGPTSTGTFNVNASIAAAPGDNVQVTELDDFAFMGTQGTAFMAQTQPFCVIRTSGGQVGLTISDGDLSDMDFRIRDVMAMLSTGLALTVTGADGVPEAMTEGIEETFNVSSVCNAMTYSHLQVAVPNSATAAAGNYSGTFTVNVAPK